MLRTQFRWQEHWLHVHRGPRGRILRVEAVSCATGGRDRYAQSVARAVSRCNVLSDRGRDGGKRAWLSGASECRVRRRIVVDPSRRGQGRCMGKDHSTRARGFEIALDRRLTKLPTAGSLTAPLEALMLRPPNSPGGGPRASYAEGRRRKRRSSSNRGIRISRPATSC